MTGWSGPKNQQNKTDKFLSLTGTLYVLVDSGKSKRKVLKEQILKYLIPSGFDARIAEIQEERHQREAQLYQTITEFGNRIQGIQYQNVGLQGKTGAIRREILVLHHQATQLQRGYPGCFANEDKDNGITAIAKSNESAEYSVCEGTRPEFCWHVIKVALYLQMEIHQMLFLHITSGKRKG